MLNIGPRLLCAALMVRKNRKTVDIGTDHAYLPAYLVMNGISERVLACDIGVKPLGNAAKTLRQFDLKDKISLRVSDGLKEVSPEEAEEITICGMGGTLMSDILRAAPWIRNEGVHLVLQPMTHSEDVREYLCENGFLITQERCVKDAGRVYCCIGAKYSGEKKDWPAGYFYFGTLSFSDELSAEFMKKQAHRVKTKLEALEKSDASNEKLPYLRDIYSYYEERCRCEGSGCL